MDVETYGAVRKIMSKADTAAEAANAAASEAASAATEANEAVAAIYHDKNFILDINADGSLSLTYAPEELNEEE